MPPRKKKEMSPTVEKVIDNVNDVLADTVEESMTFVRDPASSRIMPFFLKAIIYTFLIVTLVAIATTRMSNEENNGAVFGSFDSTGAAIILIGFPWLCLQYLNSMDKL